MMLAAVFVACGLLQIALHSAHFWWFIATCQPLLLVMVAAARRFSPLGVAWWGLAAGLACDLLTGRVVGPGGIAGAAAGIAVAILVRRFELEGPLFWTVGALVGAAGSELAWLLVYFSLNLRPDHGWLGVLATVATTTAAAMLVAMGERVVSWWTSPARTRRRVLRRL
jgi:hypothetical protein